MSITKEQEAQNLSNGCWFKRTLVGRVITGGLIIVAFIPVILGIFLLKLYQKIKKIK